MLAGATRAVSALRSAAKPLHPAGVTLTGRIHRHGSNPLAGVAWLDEPGEDDVLVRLSRAVGLPPALPDIHGMAIRVRSDEGDADLLLASTGWGRFSRFVLTASRDPSARPMTTLLPYRTDTGPLLIGARSMGPHSSTLAWAVHGGPWQTFGVLILSRRPATDQEISFDPVRHQLPGLEQYPVVVRLREPSYTRARASSDRATDTSAHR
ncbi:MAG: hypothetical protein ABWX84_05910 [Nocardioides sp.]